LIVAQHTKTMAGDHGLKHDGGVIVIFGRHPGQVGQLQSARDRAKMPDCIARSALGSIGWADPTEPAKQ
jgi:hypothetical protein